jgi:hypothetical protein
LTVWRTFPDNSGLVDGTNVYRLPIVNWMVLDLPVGGYLMRDSCCYGFERIALLLLLFKFG